MAKIEDAMLQAMTDFIRKGIEPIKDERVSDAYTKVHESMKAGYQAMADNEEKRAWLNYVLSDQCYRLGFYLWRHGLMTEALEKELRLFMLPEDAVEIARQQGDADRAADAELAKQHMEIEKRRKGIEIFQAVLAGDDLETAKKKMEEYEARQAQAMQQLATQQQAPAMQ